MRTFQVEGEIQPLGRNVLVELIEHESEILIPDEVKTYVRDYQACKIRAIGPDAFTSTTTELSAGLPSDCLEATAICVNLGKEIKQGDKRVFIIEDRDVLAITYAGKS